jgi:Ser/Thr protein kinase RdoA (MazF antagonist)
MVAETVENKGARFSSGNRSIEWESATRSRAPYSPSTAEPAATEVAMEDQASEAIDRVAAAAIRLYDLSPDAVVERINVSENTTYRINDSARGRRYALRVHRLGYQSADAIASELTWVEALRVAGVVETASTVAARDGSRVVCCQVDGLPEPRNAVLFEWLDGVAPDAEDMASFGRLGAICASLHRHARSWRRPAGFTRPTWDCDQFIGSQGRAGRWQDGLGIGSEELALLSRLEDVIRRRLDAHGRGRDRFGLTHNDLRLANLLVDGDQTYVIDFDDCGDSWYMNDWATAVSMIEHHPQLPAMQDAWVEGYRSVASLSREDEAELPTFVMLNRLFFVAWVGSHHTWAPEAAELGADYTVGTCHLAEAYLARVS